jgi:hypothetical protein
MSTSYRADDQEAADAPATAVDAVEPVDGAVIYLTDEVFLYRVVDFVVREGNRMVDLEDCYKLDVVRVPVKGVRVRRLRTVIPAPDEG